MTKLETDSMRSALMKRVRRSRTTAEEAVAAALRSATLGYRRNVRDLPGAPDFANKSKRWALFVNGCFWHHHRCVRGTTPKRNHDFWIAKFKDNRRRDARKLRELRGRGFKVDIIWECEALDFGRLGERVSKIKNGLSERGSK